MKKLLTDNFDKCMAFTLFVIVFLSAVIFKAEWMAQLARDAFIATAALYGGRKLQQAIDSVNAEKVDISTPSGVENIKEEKL